MNYAKSAQIAISEVVKNDKKLQEIAILAVVRHDKNSWKLQPVPLFQFVLFPVILFCFMVLDKIMEQWVHNVRNRKILFVHNSLPPNISFIRVLTDLIFVIFSPQMYFGAQFVSTWKHVNCGKKLHKFCIYGDVFYITHMPFMENFRFLHIC